MNAPTPIPLRADIHASQRAAMTSLTRAVVATGPRRVSTEATAITSDALGPTTRCALVGERASRIADIIFKFSRRGPGCVPDGSSYACACFNADLDSTLDAKTKDVTKPGSVPE